MNTQTTYDGYAPEVAETHADSGVVGAVRRAVRRVTRSMMTAYVERQTVRDLSSLPDYVLKDIGLHHGNIRAVASDLARERADAWARQAGGANGFGG